MIISLIVAGASLVGIVQMAYTHNYLGMLWAITSFILASAHAMRDYNDSH